MIGKDWPIYWEKRDHVQRLVSAQDCRMSLSKMIQDHASQATVSAIFEGEQLDGLAQVLLIRAGTLLVEERVVEEVCETVVM